MSTERSLRAERPATRSDGTVGKAVELLDVVAEMRRPARFVELQKHSDLPKSTLYRLLQTLVSQRLLTLDAAANTYQLGPRLMRLASAAVRQEALTPIARPHLDALSRALGQTLHLAKLDHGHVLYLDKRNATRRLEMYSDAGKVGPAYCTGVGKAMLAYLDADALQRALAEQSWVAHTANTLASPERLKPHLREIQAAGLAFDREEHEIGIICVAAPILDGDRRPLGAISITSSTLRHTLDELSAFASLLQATAQAIARDVVDDDDVASGGARPMK